MKKHMPLPTGKIKSGMSQKSLGNTYGSNHKQYGVSAGELASGITSAKKDSGGPGRFNEPKDPPTE